MNANERVGCMNVKAWLLSLLLVGSISIVEASAPARADAMSDAINRGNLRVGIAAETLLPWVGRNKAGGLIGYEVDVARDVAAALGVNARFVEIPYASLQNHLLAGDVDVIISGFSVTAERAKTVLFSNTYGETDFWLVVDTKTLPAGADKGEYDVEGYKVGVLADTVSETQALNLFQKAEIVRLAGAPAARAALEAGQLNAIVVPTPYPTFMNLRYPDRFLVGSTSLFGTSQAMAVRTDSFRLLNFINAWIVERQANGWLGGARSYWFGSLKWLSRLDKEPGATDEQPAKVEETSR